MIDYLLYEYQRVENNNPQIYGAVQKWRHSNLVTFWPLVTYCHKMLPPPPSPCDVTINFLFHFFLSVILHFFCSLLLSALHPLDYFSSVDTMQHCIPSPKQYKTFCTTRVCPSLHKNKHSSRESKMYLCYLFSDNN